MELMNVGNTPYLLYQEIAQMKEEYTCAKQSICTITITAKAYVCYVMYMCPLRKYIH